jgi:hypothetical protein
MKNLFLDLAADLFELIGIACFIGAVLVWLI